MTESLPSRNSLAIELVTAASRDITKYLSEPDNPNRRAVADAALTSLNAAIRVLSETRRTLLGELNPGRVVPDWAAGNSGPGGAF